MPLLGLTLDSAGMRPMIWYNGKNVGHVYRVPARLGSYLDSSGSLGLQTTSSVWGLWDYSKSGLAMGLRI